MKDLRLENQWTLLQYNFHFAGHSFVYTNSILS